MSKLQQERINRLTPLVKAIRNKCLDCSANNPHEVKLCVCSDCALFPYRLGLNQKCNKSTPKKDETDEKGTIREGVKHGYTKNSPQNLERSREQYIKKNLRIEG